MPGEDDRAQDDDKERLDKLGARLSAIQQAEAEKEQAEDARRDSSNSISIGMRIGIELIAGTLMGGAIGYFIDQKLNTRPIFMLAFVVLGFTAGVMDVLRILKGLDSAVGYGRAVREKEGREKDERDKADKDAAQGFRDEDEN